MHAPPVRPGIGLTNVVTVPLMVVFASSHLFSISPLEFGSA
jgi:hypothetical protein